MEWVTEQEQTLRVAQHCDVLVAGGGVAGIAAALAAARNGVQVILVDKQCVLGGLGTLGLVTVYLPLCDGMGHQVSFGIAEELLRLSIQYGYERMYPHAWLENGTPEKKSSSVFRSSIIRTCLPFRPNNYCCRLEPGSCMIPESAES